MQFQFGNQERKSRLYRLFQVVLAASGILVLTQWWWTSHKQGEQLFQQQSEELMRSTLVALSHTAAYLIVNDQLESLNQLTTHIADTPYLQDVVVYDANGAKLSASKSASPAVVMYAPQFQPELLALVQEIEQEGRVIGYIKISMKLDASLLPVTQAWQQLMQQVLWMLLVAGLVAFVIRGLWSRLLHTVQRLWKKRQAEPSNLL